MARNVAVIGAGPAGLMAAEKLSAAGARVTVYDHMPSAARKLLIAGRGGLNLTHSEPLDVFRTRYGPRRARLAPILEAFPPAALVEWAEGLGQPTFVGTSGRIFPKAMKASPLLRAWLKRLDEAGVVLKTRHAWHGWTEGGALVFTHERQSVHVTADATVLALGGASWPRLGATGAWVELLTARGGESRPAPARKRRLHRPVERTVRLALCRSAAQIDRARRPRHARARRSVDHELRHRRRVRSMRCPLSCVRRSRRKARQRSRSICGRISLGRTSPRNSRARARARRSRMSSAKRSIWRRVAINLMREAHGVALANDAEALARQIKHVPLVLIRHRGPGARDFDRGRCRARPPSMTT